MLYARGAPIFGRGACEPSPAQTRFRFLAVNPAEDFETSCLDGMRSCVMRILTMNARRMRVYSPSRQLAGPRSFLAFGRQACHFAASAEPPSVAVVGGGAAGLTAAYFAALHGAKVQKRAPACLGCPAAGHLFQPSFGHNTFSQTHLAYSDVCVFARARWLVLNRAGTLVC
jgi:hypothetical protein